MPETEIPHHRIAIVGAGLAGIGLSIALQRDGIDDFVVFERADDLGGTWRDNSYPGCACDIPSVLYSYADAPNPGWSHAFALQPEIWAYIRRVADSHGVPGHIRYREELLGADFDCERAVWDGVR